MTLSSLMIRLEKGHYPFKNYPKGRCETIVFPGCAFMSQFPRTMDRLAQLCEERGVGVAYDCCGTSLATFGKAGDLDRVTAGIQNRLKACGCKRLAVICPNCLQHFDGELDVQLITVYDLLAEWGIQQVSSFDEGVLYVPCPERKDRMLGNSLRTHFDLSAVSDCEYACCGLRPDIAIKGAENSTKCGKAVLSQLENKKLYTYCASCSGQFKRLGREGVRHSLSVILGIDEEPDAAHALSNRAKRRK